jgi:hypothetical protein
VSFPDLPDLGEEWSLVERERETLFALPTSRVRGYTVVYEDGPLREAVTREAPEAEDHPWRFLFATRLEFVPPLAPGIGPASMYPTVLSEARRSFARDLAERGFIDVDRSRGERMRTRTGTRARLSKYTARLPVEFADESIPVEAWLAVFVVGSEFRLAGGAFPTSLPVAVEVDRSRYRNELLDLIRNVA